MHTFSCVGVDFAGPSFVKSKIKDDPEMTYVYCSVHLRHKSSSSFGTGPKSRRPKRFCSVLEDLLDAEVSQN